jgi:flagella basal body P-ring formation protein FlgA
MIHFVQWLIGAEAEPGPLALRDGVHPVQSWRYLRQVEGSPAPSPFMWLAGLVIAAFLLPVLAWSLEEPALVPVLKQNLSVGEVIQEEDVEMKAVGSVRLSPRVLRRTQDIVGKEVHRRIRAGYPVYDSHVRVPPTIRKNTVVDVIYLAPGLRLNSSARALQDAGTGHSVRVQNVHSGRIVAGRALEDGRVLVKK